MAELSPTLARAILHRMGEAGQPPELGLSFVNVGNERYLSVLDREYIEPIAQSRRGSSFKLVQAHFGGGKTHFLLAVRDRAWRRGMASALVGLSPEECPMDDLARVYAAVMRELCWAPKDDDHLPDRGVEMALRDALTARRAELGEAGVAAWLEGLRRQPVDAPSLRTAVCFFGAAFLRGDLAGEELAAAFLRGEALSEAEQRLLGVRERLGRDTALRFLRALCQMLQHLGAPGLLLAFDELDRNLSLSERRRVAVADNLRQLIDLCGRAALPGLLCLYAVPPEFMRTVVIEYPALQQRLEGPVSLSERSPQAAVIDLERLDLPAEELLVRIGLKLLHLYNVGHGARLDPGLQGRNLRSLAAQVLSTSFEVAHRRAFVKAAIDLLHHQAQSPHAIGEDEARQSTGKGGKILLLRPPASSDPFDAL